MPAVYSCAGNYKWCLHPGLWIVKISPRYTYSTSKRLMHRMAISVSLHKRLILMPALELGTDKLLYLHNSFTRWDWYALTCIFVRVENLKCIPLPRASLKGWSCSSLIAWIGKLGRKLLAIRVYYHIFNAMLTTIVRKSDLCLLSRLPD